MDEGTLSPWGVSDVAKVRQNDDTPGFSGVMASTDDMHFIELLRRGDEAAFVSLIDHYHASMLRLAQVFVPTRAVAEEVVQEAWVGVLQGLHRFEGRSSLKTWIFRRVASEKALFVDGALSVGGHAANHAEGRHQRGLGPV